MGFVLIRRKNHQINKFDLAEAVALFFLGKDVRDFIVIKDGKVVEPKEVEYHKLEAELVRA